MGKDPAFLFYPGDWLGGTMTFNRYHKGAYMDLLMAQFNCGRLHINDIKDILGDDFVNMWDAKLRAKFKCDTDGLFYNQRLEEELVKRKKFSQSRKNNLIHKKTHAHMNTHMGTHMRSHMENENENENRNVIVNGNKEKKTIFTPPTLADVQEYFFTKAVTWPVEKANDQAQRFYDHYESNGWRVGKNKMRKWHNAASGWINRQKDYENNNSANQNNPNAGGNDRVGRMAKTDLEHFMRMPIPDIKL